MNRSLRVKSFVLGITFLLAFVITIPAAAEGPVVGDTIPADVTYDHDAILIGQNVTIDGTVNGNVFVLGNQATVNGTIDGSLIILGQNVGIAGSVSGEVYAGALTVDLGPNASIKRDMYVAAVSMTSGKASLIGRDLYAVGLDSGLNGQVARDLHTVIGPIQLYNGIVTLLGYQNLTIKLRIDTPAGSSSGSRLAVERLGRVKLSPPVLPKPFDWGQWALALLRNWAVLFLFGLLAFWLARKAMARSGEELRQSPWQALGTGLLVLVGSIAAVAVAFLLVVAVFAIGLGLNSIGLWPLTLALWVTGYAALAVALVGLWAFIVYGTKIVAIYFVSTWLFGKVFRRQSVWLNLLALFLGTVLYSLLVSIPYVGWVFNLIVTSFGAGASWLAYRSATRKARPAKIADEFPVVTEPEPILEVIPAAPVVPAPVIPPLEPQPVIAPVEPEPVLMPVEPEQQPTLKLPRRKVAASTRRVKTGSSG